MRILIGNDRDTSLISNEDVRSWTQRILWFAEDGDLIILPGEADRDFLESVCTLLNVNAASLHIVQMPKQKRAKYAGQSEGLCDPDFVKSISKKLNQVTDIIALWPSQYVARFATALGLENCLQGHTFFGQNGGELCSNKAFFRAAAGGIKIPVPHGMVCHSVDEAILSTTELFQDCDAVMVKKAHAGGGGGNQLLSRNREITADFAGAAYEYRITGTDKSIKSYWSEHWNWLSFNNKFAVVIEEFVPNADSIYAEFYCSDFGVGIPQIGSLKYANGSLAAEIIPNRGLASIASESLVFHGTRLAEYYKNLGYRGFLSADAIVTADGHIQFTEVNAQYTGSTHLYKIIGERIARIDPQSEATVLQMAYPGKTSTMTSFLSGMKTLGLYFDKKNSEGVIPAWPIVKVGKNSALMICVVSKSAKRMEEILDSIE